MRVRRTGWLSGEVQPVRKGVYERKFTDGRAGGQPFFCRWNGTWWSLGSFNLKKAAKEFLPSTSQYLPWRGVERG